MNAPSKPLEIIGESTSEKNIRAGNIQHPPRNGLVFFCFPFATFSVCAQKRREEPRTVRFRVINFRVSVSQPRGGNLSRACTFRGRMPRTRMITGADVCTLGERDFADRKCMRSANPDFVSWDTTSGQSIEAE